MFRPLIVLVVVAPILLSLVALGMGWFLSSFFPITLVQAAWLWMASFVIVVAVIAYSTHYSHFLDDFMSVEGLDEDEDDDGDDDKLPF